MILLNLWRYTSHNQTHPYKNKFGKHSLQHNLHPLNLNYFNTNTLILKSLMGTKTTKLLEARQGQYHHQQRQCIGSTQALDQGPV